MDGWIPCLYIWLGENSSFVYEVKWINHKSYSGTVVHEDVRALSLWQRYQTCSCMPACRLQHKPRLCSMHTAGVLFSVWPNLRVTGFYLQALFVAKSPVARHLDQIISVSHPAPEIDLLCSASELEHQVKRPYNQRDPIQASEQKFRASTLHQL